MPRYFFHIKEEAVTMLDHEGVELENLHAVRNEATQAARQSISERVLDGHGPDGRTFVVTDEQGRTVLTFPFKDAISD
jgi:hypothetical protein